MRLSGVLGLVLSLSVSCKDQPKPRPSRKPRAAKSARGRSTRAPPRQAAGARPQLIIEEHASAKLAKFYDADQPLRPAQVLALVPARVARKRRAWRRGRWTGKPGLALDEANRWLRPLGYRLAATAKGTLLYRGRSVVDRFRSVDSFAMDRRRRHFSFRGQKKDPLLETVCLDGKLVSRFDWGTPPVWIDGEPWRLKKVRAPSVFAVVRGFPGRTKTVFSLSKWTEGAGLEPYLHAAGRDWALEIGKEIIVNGKRVAMRALRYLPSVYVVGGRFLYFFERAKGDRREIGVSYDGRVQPVSYDDVGGPMWLLWHNRQMVFFAAQRGRRAYYVEAGLFREKPSPPGRSRGRRRRGARLSQRWRHPNGSFLLEEFASPELTKFLEHHLTNEQVTALLPARILCAAPGSPHPAQRHPLEAVLQEAPEPARGLLGRAADSVGDPPRCE